MWGGRAVLEGIVLFYYCKAAYSPSAGLQGRRATTRRERGVEEERQIRQDDAQDIFSFVLNMV